MKKLNKLIILFLAFLFFILASNCASENPLIRNQETEKTQFDTILALTQQDGNMDWIHAVPSRYIPEISTTDKVTKGEKLIILPMFNNYGLENKNHVNISYDVDIFNPDGSIYHSKKSITGFKGPVPGPYILSAMDILIVSFESKDPFGAYTIVVTSYDHAKQEKSIKREKIELYQFKPLEIEDHSDNYFLDYLTDPKPSHAISEFLSNSRRYLDDKNHPLWSALWFYKHIFNENDFLISPTIEIYKNNSNLHQAKDILLLFYLLEKAELLPVTNEHKNFLKFLKNLNIPDPYDEIKTADQLDMLWGEFFATSRVKPIRQIITAFNLNKHVGTIEKFQKGELDLSLNDTKDKMFLEAVFRSAIWSIRSNCKQAPLLFQYCVGLYESGKLNKDEKGYLGAIIKEVSDEKQK